LQDCPTSKLLKFSLGQEYEFQGDVENMLSCFDEAQFPEAPSSHVICEARYAYLWGRFDKAASYVRPILTAYWQVRVLDDHFLYIRGLPFFGQVWAYFAAFARLTGNYAELEAITDRARANCSDFDFEALIADLGAFRTGNYDAIKRKLQDAIQQAQQSRWPTGYQRVKLAVLNGQDAASYSDAKRILDSVVLEKNDFQWLTDILLLAACEAARKHGHGDKEAELVGRFMARQPLLFEPNHAVNFNLLGYQETLKIRYQATRQPSR
jgi:tetratricopeptide (TPR) repeat protein